MITTEKIRNIAIIAHVDHGKTTLVDAMLKQSGTYRDNETVVDRVMDSMDLERERGITIMAKNTSVRYGDYKINIVDTPGHADFGGEVERVLKMVDGIVLLVDAAEGCLPQTRFVLRKALELKLPGDRSGQQDRPPGRAARRSGRRDLRPVHRSRRERPADRVPDPLLDLARRHREKESGRRVGKNLKPLFDQIIETIPAPHALRDDSLQLACREHRLQPVRRPARDRPHFLGRDLEEPGSRRRQDATARRRKRASKSFSFSKASTAQRSTTPASARSSRLPGLTTSISAKRSRSVENPKPLPVIAVDEPTISMIFGVNTSPFSGIDGKFVTSRQIKDRLDRELLGNVALRVDARPRRAEQFKVSGRGELQLAILIEMMRREGYELQVSKPEVITKKDEKTGETAGADRAGRHRRARRIYRRRHRSDGPPQRPDDQDDQQRLGPRAAGIRSSVARADRFSRRVSDRNERHRFAQHAVPAIR